jgi:hypothetical protein
MASPQAPQDLPYTPPYAACLAPECSPDKFFPDFNIRTTLTPQPFQERGVGQTDDL